MNEVGGWGRCMGSVDGRRPVDHAELWRGCLDRRSDARTHRPTVRGRPARRLAGGQHPTEIDGGQRPRVSLRFRTVRGPGSAGDRHLAGPSGAERHAIGRLGASDRGIARSRDAVGRRRQPAPAPERRASGGLRRRSRGRPLRPHPIRQLRQSRLVEQSSALMVIAGDTTVPHDRPPSVLMRRRSELAASVNAPTQRDGFGRQEAGAGRRGCRRPPSLRGPGRASGTGRPSGRCRLSRAPRPGRRRGSGAGRSKRRLSVRRRGSLSRSYRRAAEAGRLEPDRRPNAPRRRSSSRRGPAAARRSLLPSPRRRNRWRR